jgi:predicted RNase H-like HicB family nuclease
MLLVESEQEEDGRWIAEVVALPGVMAYGDTKAEADAKAKALALRVIADRLENGEQLPAKSQISLKPHDSMAVGKGAACLCRAFAPGSDDQTTIRLASCIAADGLGRLHFCISRSR